MSSALALAAVTAVLKDLLNNGLIDHNVTGAIGGNVTVTALPPDRVFAPGAPESSQLNLFLHQVTPNASWRNVGLPSRGGRGERLSNPPLALDLHYLLTAYGAEDFHAEILLGYCSIYSPLDGRTGSLMVHPGNVVKANDVSLVVIHQIRPVYVNFSVPERSLAEIKSRIASGRLRVNATIPGDEGKPVEGILTFVDNAVDNSTGTIHLKGTFANPDRRLWPGQFVDVVLRLSAQPLAIVVPSRAVQTSQSGEFVFVVKPDLTAEMRPIVVSRSVAGETVVEKGLKPGESVVTDGQLRLVPGAKVQIKNLPQTSQAASS